jgi:stringent starvation protein B
MTQLLPPKKEVALALLERSNVDIYLDPRAKGVVVPPQFRKEPRLILKVGLNMPVPIPDLRLDDESMSCTLSFSRSPFYCVVPWPSVFAMVGDDGRGMVWPDDVPQELAVRVAEEGQRQQAKAEAEAEAARPREKTRAARDKGGKSKRAAAGAKSKKKDEVAPTSERPRPQLVAVPASAPSAPAAPAARTPAKEDRVSPVPRAPAAQRAAPQGRPKRELPPYLRVVK